jgi:DNA modification methylase
MKQELKQKKRSTKQDMLDQCPFMIKDEFGFIPKSVMAINRNKELDEFVGDKHCKLRNLGNLGKAKRRGGGDASKINYSLFNTGLCDFIYHYFFNKNDLILDPFMGKAARPVIAILRKLRYIGFEVDDETIKYVHQRIKHISNLKGLNPQINILNEDGVRMNSLSAFANVFDGILTCPPYCNVEKYSGKGNDISYCKTWEDYSKEIEILMENCYRLIKPSDYKKNKFHLAIFVVGSVRDGKKGLLDMDSLFQNAAKKSGFIFHDKFTQENVPSTTLHITASSNYVKRYTGKVHETVLVFRKEQ